MRRQNNSMEKKMEIFIKRPEHSIGLREEQKKQTHQKRKRLKDRRKARKDRRQSVNEGLLVRLSTRKERRSPKERRGGGSHPSPQTSGTASLSPTRFEIRI